MKIRFGECEACKAYKDSMAFMEAQIARLTHERENERAEFKRAVDALLTVLKAPAIGQGSSEYAKPMDLQEIFGIFEEKPDAEKAK